MTPLQAIHAKCVDCCGGDTSEVKKCPAKGCPLHPFRRGKKPRTERTYSPEQTERLVSRLTSKNA